MTEQGYFLVNGEWSDRQIPTPVSPLEKRYRKGVSYTVSIV